MIVSVSRRTDIPAFYSDWFFNRLKEEEVYVKNPYNSKQVSRVFLNQEIVDCFVFWTKDPYNFMNHKDFKLLDGYKYYFQFTLTSYKRDIEESLRKKRDIIETFKLLSDQIGRERVVWRYDPILLNKTYSREYHYTWFERFAKELEGYTDKCIISFIDEYKETKKNRPLLELDDIKKEDMIEISQHLKTIAVKYNIKLEVCAETIDLEEYGIEKGRCVDPDLISSITGIDFSLIRKDRIRKNCNCIKSIDIGAYNTCMHSCLYCYANYNSSFIYKNIKQHDKHSKLLVGGLEGDEKITVHYLCKEKTAKTQQISFLNR